MAIKTAAVTVGTTATRLDVATDADYDAEQIVLVRLPTDSVTVTVGGSDVATTTGIPLYAGEAQEIHVQAGDQLFGIVATGTQAVRVLQVGV